MPDELKPQPPDKQQAPPAKPAPKPKPPVEMVTQPWEGDLPNTLKEQFGEEIAEYVSYLGQNFLVAKTAAVVSVIGFLRDKCGFDYLVDITAADWPKRAERFDVIYILYSFSRNERIRVKIRVNDGERPPTATGVHPTANWLEREVYDMFGIQFEGHPDMKRILMPDDWTGHPLRKDYSILQMDERWVHENLGIESGQ
jgi:NADH-quinone oxidoreductase subunit C